METSRKRRHSAEGEAEEAKRIRRSYSEPAVCPEERRKNLWTDCSTPRLLAGTKLAGINPIEYWTHAGSWPRDLFQHTLGGEKEVKIHTHPEEMETISSSQRTSETTTLNTSTTGTKKKLERLYRKPTFPKLLETKAKSYMSDHVDGMKQDCLKLFELDQPVPESTLFSPGSFEKACNKLAFANEARVIQDIGRLMVPSVETLASLGTTGVEILAESVQECWSRSLSIIGSRPHPDYAVGFADSAFTDAQLKKLDLLVGKLEDELDSFYRGTWRMYFPFLTCEVKCGDQALQIADNQNAHSMTLAVRGILELYRLVKRQHELDREVLAFSISHNHELVRVYAHYAVVRGEERSIHRHSILRVDFTSQEGKERWTTYKFVRSVYSHWMPAHLKRIQSAIDDLPAGIDFEVSELPAVTTFDPQVITPSESSPDSVAKPAKRKQMEA